MNAEERLKFVRSLFDASVKLEEKRALEKKLSKRKREESGNSINSSMSTASSNKNTSPPNKKRRSAASSNPVIGEDGQSNITIDDTTIESCNQSLDISLPFKKRGV